MLYKCIAKIVVSQFCNANEVDGIAFDVKLIVHN